jgi:two-component system, OmpR family, phosphate regulon response regulator PhoB
VPGEASTPTPSGAKRLLIVDDDEEVRRLVSRVLRSEGYEVEEAADAPSMRAALGRQRPDLVVLDLVLGSADGLDELSELRKTMDIPVILLTGKSAEVDRVLGLKLGADDYMVKPFYPAELSARIGAILRRRAPAPGGNLGFGALEIDLVAREVLVEGQVVDMTAKEFDLLAFLARSPRQVFSREQILDQVWDSSSEWQDSATVTEHVRRIRRKIEADPDAPKYVCTVRGVGYRFEP